ncbi:MAG TPA: AAA family ATPase, partial [Solirubrobacteraceae bacterium]
TDGTVLTDCWIDELHRLGFRSPTHPTALHAARTGALDRDAAVNRVLSRLGSKRSAWNAADIRGQVELLISSERMIADPAVRIELAEDLTARAVAASVPLLDDDIPEHIRALTSRDVLGVEADLSNSFAVRASLPGLPVVITGGDLDEKQMQAVATLAGKHRLVVVEGAAGAGKTATLAGTRTVIAQTGHRMIVVTPTLKAAQVVAIEIGSQAHSAAWLARQYGFSWDNDGRWTRELSVPSSDALLCRGDLLLIDEAGMLDQDTARALVTIADETGARLTLVGDRHQLPAVGRGGVLDLAARWADPDARLTLDNVHRFADPDYAKLSLAMRSAENPEAVFDLLVQRGQIVVHSDETSRTAALADDAAATGALVVADTREQVADLNQAIRERLVTAGQVDDSRVLVTDSGERIGVGDRVATRRNDYDLGVANRDTWIVTGVRDDGTMHLVGTAGTRELPLRYAVLNIELAYASTAYGAQGETTRTAHLALGEHTGAASAYVAMTRGRETNIAHLVAEDLNDARQQWTLTFARNRTDLGPAHAARLAAEEAAKYEPYVDPRYLDKHHDSAPVSRRRPEPPPTLSRRPGAGPGIGF